MVGEITYLYVRKIGYNEKFTVDTNELMESRGPRYRQLQEKEYLKVINGVQENDASVCESVYIFLFLNDS